MRPEPLPTPVIPFPAPPAFEADADPGAEHAPDWLCVLVWLVLVVGSWTLVIQVVYAVWKLMRAWF